jgi:hypothetical protein
MKFGQLNKTTGLLGMEDGDSPFTRNMILAKNGNVEGISNEEGFNLIANLNRPIIGVITTNDNRDIIFSGEVNSIHTPEIGQLVNGVYSIIIKDNILGFKNSIEGTYYYNNLNELIIAWWDGVYDTSNVPRVLNLDCLPFKLNVDKTFVNSNDVQLLSISPNLTLADYELLNINNTGGKLKTGAYFITYSIQYDDDSLGGFQNLSPAIFISKPISDVYNNFNGDEGDIETTKAITIRITNLSNYIKKITLGVIKKINGIYTAITIPDIPVSGGTVDYTYTGFVEFDSSLDEILIPRASIIRAQAGTQLENRLYLGNIHQPNFPNIQQYVNGIQVKWVAENDIALSEKNDSLKDMTFIFKQRNFKSNEVYALYFIGYLPTGESIAFNIPGAAPIEVSFVDEEDNVFVTQENALLSSILPQHPTSITVQEGISIAPNARVHELFNTAAISGKMGYWENQNEFYEDIDCSDIRNEFDTVVGTLRNAKVRHHKMPNIKLLKDTNTDWVTGTNLNALQIIRLQPTNNAFPINWGVISSNTPSDFGSLSGPQNNIFTFNKDCNIRIEFGLDVDVSVAASFSITHISGVAETNLIVFDYPTGTVSNTNATPRYAGARIKKGDSIRFSFNGGATWNPTNSYFELWDWSFERYNAESKILGIKLENIKIPTALRNKFVKFELGYAERTEDNATIVSATAMKGVENLRMYPPDIFTFRKENNYDYLESQVAYEVEEGVADLSNELSRSFIRKTEDSQYIPGFSITAVENNFYNEEFIYSRLNTVLPDIVGYDMEDIWNIVDLKKYKTSVYFNFKDQKIVNTGVYFANNLVTTPGIYNGDTFINLYGWYAITRTDPSVDLSFGNNFWIVPRANDISTVRYMTVSYVMPIESTVNTGYMNHLEAAKYALNTHHMVDFVNAPAPFLGDKEAKFFQTDNVWSYNTDYHSILNFKDVLHFDCGSCHSDLQNRFPYRIYRSAVFNKDSNNLNWRSINTGDYFELTKNKGVIWVLRTMNRSLMINTRYSFFVAGPKDKLATDTLDAYLSVGDIFDRPPEEVLSVDQGYGGCQSKWAAFVCKAGYIFPDMQQGKIFLYNGKLQEMTDAKMRNYFRDEMKRTYLINGMEIDDPFKAQGLVGAWDEKHNRILFGKRTRDGDGEESDSVFMFSFSFINNAWVSEHDYISSLLYFNRNGLFSVDNGYIGTVGKIYQHNANNLCTYYEGIVKTAFADIAIVENMNNKIWHNITWSSYSEKNGALDNTKTVSAIMVYNDHQCSPLTIISKLTTLGFNNINTRNDIQYWNFNQLDDIVQNQNSLFMSATGATNVGNLNANKVWFKKSEFRSKMLIVRFSIDNTDQRKVTLIDVSAFYTPTS